MLYAYCLFSIYSGYIFSYNLLEISDPPIRSSMLFHFYVIYETIP